MTPAIFWTRAKMWPTPPKPKFASHHPRSHAPTLPTPPPTLFSRLVKLMWTAKTKVYQRNSSIDISLETVQDFVLYTSKVFPTDKKLFESWQCSQNYYHNCCHSHVFIIISKHTAWLEDSEGVAPRVSLKKVILNIS